MGEKAKDSFNMTQSTNRATTLLNTGDIKALFAELSFLML